MRQLLQRITTSFRWFAGFVVVLIVIVLFFWRLFDQQGFTDAINGFLRDITTLFEYILKLFLICVGLALILGWRPWGRRNNNRGGGH